MPVTRWLVALGCAGLLLVACGQSDSPVIGVRPQSEVSPSPVAFDPSPFMTKLVALIDESNSLTAINEGALAPGQLPIDTLLTFKQQLRLVVLQQLGVKAVDKRLSAIASVRGQVGYDPFIIGLLDGATAQLDQMRVTIARDQLVDQTRIDVKKVYKLYIGPLVLPQARMLSAASVLRQLAALYTNEQASLQQQVYAVQSTGKDVRVAQADVTDISNQIAIINNSTSYAVSVLEGLTAAGYPGNKSSLIGARSSLTAGRYAGIQAEADASGARTALGY